MHVVFKKQSKNHKRDESMGLVSQPAAKSGVWFYGGPNMLGDDNENDKSPHLPFGILGRPVLHRNRERCCSLNDFSAPN